MKRWEQEMHRRMIAGLLFLAGILAGIVGTCLHGNLAVYLGLVLALIGGAWLLLEAIIGRWM
jgi:hypothetical protein